MVGMGPRTVLSIVRDLVPGFAGGLAAIGLLVVVTGRHRPLTPSLAALVPVGVVLGQCSKLWYDLYLVGTGSGWAEYTAANLVVAGFGFAIPLGSALKRRAYPTGTVALGVVVLVYTVSIHPARGPVEWIAGFLSTALILGVPAVLTGYVFTDGGTDGTTDGSINPGGDPDGSGGDSAVR